MEIIMLMQDMMLWMMLLSNKGLVTIRNDVSLEIHTENIDYGYMVNVSVNLPSDTGGNVTLFIAGKNYSINNINGSFIYTIPEKLGSGNYIIQASYSGDSNYSSNSSSYNFTIHKVVPEIIINSPSIVVGNQAIISVNTPGSGKLAVIVNEKEYVVDSSETINISNLSNGVYKVFVFYEGDENYTSATNKSILTVEKIQLMNLMLTLKLLVKMLLLTLIFQKMQAVI